MPESILAVDSRAIQLSLTVLEERYCTLQEIGERRFEAWAKHEAGLKQQLAAQAETLQQMQTARDEQAARVQGLEGEVALLKAERDAAAKHKANAEQSAADLKQQLAAQAESLQQAQEARDEQASQLQGLDAELAHVKVEHEALAKEKGAAEQSAAELKQQLAAQAETLQQMQTARDEQAARVQGLEGDLALLKAERDGLIAGLHRLRHVARPAGQPL